MLRCKLFDPRTGPYARKPKFGQCIGLEIWEKLREKASEKLRRVYSNGELTVTGNTIGLALEMRGFQFSIK